MWPAANAAAPHSKRPLPGPLRMGIYAVYASRQQLPLKLRYLIDLLV
jgi:hypothetical protein